MTISSTTNRKEYTGNGATTAFGFPYPFEASTDLRVFERTIATGAIVEKTAGTDFTVTGAGNSAGGTVTATTAPANTVNWIIVRDPARTQGVALVNGEKIDVDAAINTPLDALTLMVQRQNDRADRSIHAPDGDLSANAAMELPNATTRANKPIVFGSDGAVGLGSMDYDVLIAAIQQLLASSAISGSPKILQLSKAVQLLPDLNDVSIAAAAAGAILSIDADYTLSTDTVIAALASFDGGEISLNGHSLTMGTFYAPSRKIIDISGGGTLVGPAPSPAYGEWFGAVGDGTTNDSASLQFAIDWMTGNGGGVLQLNAKTYVANIVVKPGVSIRGNATGWGYLGTNPAPISTIKAATSGVVVDTPNGGGTRYNGIHLSAFNVLGLGSDTALIGVRLNAGATWCSIEKLHVFDTADQGVYSDADTHACVFDKILVVGALANQTRSSIAGSVEIHGLDHWISNVEAGCSQLSSFSVNYDIATPLFTAGLWIDGSDHRVISCSGEASDCGFYSSTTGKTQFVGCFPNFNWGHGWIDKSSGTHIVSTFTFANGRAAAATYDGFYKLAGGGSINMDMFTCQTQGGNNVMRYAVNDQSADATGIGVRSRYAGVRQLGGGTATYNFVAAFAGPEIVISDGPTYTLTVNSATPSVDNWLRWRTANTGATVITNFTNGVSGQEITVQVTDANTTIQQGSAIKMLNGADITGKGVYKFMLWNGVWHQTGGSGAQLPAVVTYAGTMVPNLSKGLTQQITVTNGSGFTISNPTSPTANTDWVLQLINTSGGAMGAITLGAAFKAAGFVAPATGKTRFYGFRYDGTNHILTWQGADQ